MKKGFFIYSIILLGFSQHLYAKNLGTLGDVWQIQEQNLLSVIEHRLNEKFTGEQGEKFKEETQKRITESVLRPTPTELPRATVNSERSFDPSYTVERDLTDHKGQVLARKGQVVNPFDIVPFNRTLIFINGDDDKQVEWYKQFKPETEIYKIILISGNLKDVTEKLDEELYFDQHGTLINRFHIRAVPTVIDELKGQKLLRIREFGIK